MAYDNTNSGALFKNDRKTKETHPLYTGTLNVEGVEYWMSAWLKDGRTGKFMSIALTAKDVPPQPKPASAPVGDDELDDIPF